jgi:hypothetical protein
MNMMVSATALATATPAGALSVSPDQELIDIAREVSDRLPALHAANLKSDGVWEAFDARKPARSDVLKYRLGDFVGFTMEHLPSGKAVCWCDPIGIATQRKVRQYDWSLSVENEPTFFALPEDDQLLQFGAPHPSAQHLFSKTPSARKQNRINKLLLALDEHTAACDALKAELGCDEVSDAVDRLYDPIAELVERMEAIEAATVAGLQAKAKVLLCWNWDDADGGTENEDPVAVKILKGLAALRLVA